MLTYVSEFTSGGLEPFWPHFWLLSVSVLASFSVGAGIIFESPKYSTSINQAATCLVICGVIIEAVCTIALFVFDEGISSSQQSKIIALETRLAPRFISVDGRNRIAEKMKQFSGQEYAGAVASDVGDAWDTWRQISLSLELANWRRLPPVGLAVTQYGPSAGIVIAPQSGVMILFAGSRWKELHERAQALANAIMAEGIAAGAGPASGAVDQIPNAITIAIGPKPQ
jgi:hypothetical protein